MVHDFMFGLYYGIMHV